MKTLISSILLLPMIVWGQVNEHSPVVPETFNDTLLERLIVEELNLKRKYHGKTSLDWNDIIQAPAKLHVQAMVNDNFFSHSNPRNSQMRDLETRMESTGLSLEGWAENILYTDNLGLNGDPYFIESFRGEDVVKSQRTGKIVRPISYRDLAISMVDQWMGSKGHRRNMLYNEFNITAAAVEIKPIKDAPFPLIYAVLVFGKM